MKLLELEISGALDPTGIGTGSAGAARRYPQALCLVRLHRHPLGFVWLPAQVTAEGIAMRVWSELAHVIREHLRADGLQMPDSLTPAGLASPPSMQPRCLAELDRVRQHAPFATVVVATHERPDSLRRCLDAVCGLEYPSFEVVVVDNAPRTDATRETLQRDFRDRVRYVHEPRPGLAMAHNRGVREARGAVIAFTDDDVIVDRQWLLELARGFALADRVACVTGLIAPAELETPAQLVAEQRWGWGKGFAESVFDASTDSGDKLYPYAAGKFGSGANMAFTRAGLEAIGGFDPATGAGTPARGGDDLSAFFSVIASEQRLVYNPAALVLHAHHSDHRALRRQAFGYGAGLTAYLTKTVLDSPSRMRELGRLVRPGLARARSLRSGQSLDPGAGSHALLAAERAGMLYGPIGYVRGKRRLRNDAGG